VTGKSPLPTSGAYENEDPVCRCHWQHDVDEDVSWAHRHWAQYLRDSKRVSQRFLLWFRCPARPGATRPTGTRMVMPHRKGKPRFRWIDMGGMSHARDMGSLGRGTHSGTIKEYYYPGRRVDPKVGPKHPLPGAPPKSWTEAHG